MIPRPQDQPAACAECGAPLAGDQRYCLQCGARHGAPRVDPLGALGFPVDAVSPEAIAPAQDVPAAGTGVRGRGRAPSRRLTAALAAATLVGGAVLGAALGPGPAPSIAAAPQRLVALVVPGAAPAAPAVRVPHDAPAVDQTPSTPSSHAASSGAAASTSGGASTTSNGSSSDQSSAPSHAPSPAPAPSDTTPAPTSSTPSATAAATPHVWIISLSQLDAAAAFGPASPLADLVAKGTLLRGYAPAGPTAAANGIALLGGVLPTADCAAGLAACVQPATQPTLPDQLRAAGKTWRAYVDDPAARCAGPVDRVAVSLFHSLADRPDCTTNVVGPETLAGDLSRAAATPALSLIGAPPALADATGPVHDAVAKITASPAYADGGIVLITVDAPPPATDPAAALPAVGTLVLAARATAGKAIDTPTGPVALLRSLADLLGLDPAPGGAAQVAAGPLDAVLAPPVASASAASLFPHRSRPPITTRRSS
jgi:hypothetical protein